LTFSVRHKTVVEIHSLTAAQHDLHRILNPGETQRIEVALPVEIRLDRIKGVKVLRDGIALSPIKRKIFVIKAGGTASHGTE
jgi:hypothetical protein